MRRRSILVGLFGTLSTPSAVQAFTLRPLPVDDAAALQAACPGSAGTLRSDDATGTCPLCGCAVFGSRDHGEARPPG